MVEKTPNHALNLYQTGDQNWTHTPDMETIEKRLWIPDSGHPDMNDYIPHTNAAYLDINTGDVYLGDGIDWNLLGTIADSASDSSREALVLQSFEDGSISEYEGDTGVFSVVPGDIAGSSMLQFDGAGVSGHHVIATDTIQTERMRSYVGHVRPNSGEYIACGMVVCATIDAGDVTEGYSINFDAGTEEFRIAKKTTDNDWRDNYLVTDTPTINGGTLYRIEVLLGKNVIRARLVNTTNETIVSNISTTDTDYQSGALGWHGASGQDSTADYDFAAQTIRVADKVGSSNGGGGTTGDSNHSWFNILDYGADPDGNNDSTAEIQNAVDDAGAAGGGTVFAPSGTYLMGNVVLTSAHNGVTVMGEGYATEFRGNADSTMWQVRDGNNPIFNITLTNFRVNGNGMGDRGIRLDPSTHLDSRGITIDTVWVHNTDSTGIGVGTNATYVTGIRVWNAGHNGISFLYPGTVSADEVWRVGDNIIAWDNPSNGIDVSKQSGIISNFITYNNRFGMKTSNESHSHTITDGYFLFNDDKGFRTTESGHHTMRIDNCTAEGNGDDGFEFGSGSTWQIGSIYSRNNAGHGVQFRSDSTRCVAQSIISENNGGDDLNMIDNAEADVFHYMGGDVNDNGNLWMARGDWGGAQH